MVLGVADLTVLVVPSKLPQKHLQMITMAKYPASHPK